MLRGVRTEAPFKWSGTVVPHVMRARREAAPTLLRLQAPCLGRGCAASFSGWMKLVLEGPAGVAPLTSLSTSCAATGAARTIYSTSRDSRS